MDINTVQIIVLGAIFLGALLRFLQTYTSQGNKISMDNFSALIAGVITSVLPLSLDIFNNFTIQADLTTVVTLGFAFAAGYTATFATRYAFAKTVSFIKKVKA